MNSFIAGSGNCELKEIISVYIVIKWLVIDDYRNRYT